MTGAFQSAVSLNGPIPPLRGCRPSVLRHMEVLDLNPAMLARTRSTTSAEEHPDASQKVAILKCCCCGGFTRGRQFSNQDLGFGLGSCCVEFVRPRVDDMEATYGVLGVHYFASVPAPTPAPLPPEPLRR